MLVVVGDPGCSASHCETHKSGMKISWPFLEITIPYSLPRNLKVPGCQVLKVLNHIVMSVFPWIAELCENVFLSIGRLSRSKIFKR